MQGWLAQLALKRRQGIDQRDARAGQGRQLACQLTQLGTAQALSARLPGTAFEALQLAGEQALLAQQLACVAFGIGLQAGFVGLAG
ncbi:hypothetical protein D3C80_1925830 [compost metagenome]